MIEKIRNNIGLFMIIIAVLLFTIVITEINIHKYEVRFTYCDGRPQKTIIVKSNDVPSNKDIQTHKEALPRAFNEINVCELETLRKIDQ
jgi:hypothetical protein